MKKQIKLLFTGFLIFVLVGCSAKKQGDFENDVQLMMQQQETISSFHQTVNISFLMEDVAYSGSIMDISAEYDLTTEDTKTIGKGTLSITILFEEVSFPFYMDENYFYYEDVTTGEKLKIDISDWSEASSYDSSMNSSLSTELTGFFDVTNYHEQSDSKTYEFIFSKKANTLFDFMITLFDSTDDFSKEDREVMDTMFKDATFSLTMDMENHFQNLTVEVPLNLPEENEKVVINFEIAQSNIDQIDSIETPTDLDSYIEEDDFSPYDDDSSFDF